MGFFRTKGRQNLIHLFLGLCLGWPSAMASTKEDKGKELYLSYGCALCHGKEGDGHGVNAQKSNPPPTNFHLIKAYLHGFDKDSIRRSIHNGIKEDNSIMPAFEDIPPEDLDQIIDYLRSLQQGKDIMISKAWVQAMPPSQKVSAGYMTVTNNTPQETVLVSVSTDIAGACEIHQMSHINGMMKMARISNVPIPAKGHLTLEPGGFHIMLIDLRKPVNKGDIVPMTLHFQDGSSILVKADVRDE